MAIEDDEVDNGVNPGSLAFLGVVFLPAGITAAIFYLLLRKGRLRLSSVFQIFLIFEALMVLLWLATDCTGKIVDTFTNLTAIGSNWSQLLLPLTLFYSFAGAVFGLFIVWWEIRQMKTNPHRLELKGNWQYQFKFRRGISQVLKRRKNIEGLKLGRFVDEEKAPLGLNEEEDDRVVSRYYAEAATHTMVSGASGSGKSITLQSLIRADIENGLPTAVIDFKRSPEFASKLSKWCKDFNRDFYHFVNGELQDYDIKYSEGPVRYDPIGGGGRGNKASSPTAKADMVLGMREYDTASAVYKANMQQLLQVLFSMLHYADRSKAPSIKWDNGGVYQLASAVSGDNFTELAIACENTPIEVEAQEVAAQLKGKTGLRHAMEELQGQIRTIISSEYGQWMRTSSSDRGVDLYELTSKPGSVILFSLNSDSEPEFAKYVGSMILADITNTSARRRNQQLQNKVAVYVDEFQAVNPSSVTSLLEKSRESKIAVTLAQQSFEQVVAAAPQNGEAYLLSILDTCSNFIVHNGMTEDSAERLSKILGKHWVTKYKSTNKNQSFFLSVNWKNKRDSVVNTSEEEVWVFPPRKFMTLMSPSAANGYKSTAVVINKSCSDPLYAGREGAVARRVWMLPDNEVLESYYDNKYRLVGPEGQSNISVVHEDGTSVDLAHDADLDFSNVGLGRTDWEEIVPVSDERPAVARPAVREEFTRPSPSPLLDDGGFGFEFITEEDEQEPELVLDEAQELEAYREDLSERSDMPKPAPDDILSQWSADVISPPKKRVQPLKESTVKEEPLPLAPPPPAPKPQRPVGLPKPSTGLPVPSRGLPTKPKTQDGEEPEDVVLPGL